MAARRRRARRRARLRRVPRCRAEAMPRTTRAPRARERARATTVRCSSTAIEATAFLKHMVRNIVGTLVEVGLGERPRRRRWRTCSRPRPHPRRRDRAAARAHAGRRSVLIVRPRDTAGPVPPARAPTSRSRASRCAGSAAARRRWRCPPPGAARRMPSALSRSAATPRMTSSFIDRPWRDPATASGSHPASPVVSV